MSFKAEVNLPKHIDIEKAKEIYLPLNQILVIVLIND